MPLSAIIDRKLSIISGKGGVGKTTVAMAVARLASSSGRKTLLAEVASRGYISRVFAKRELTPAPVLLADNLYGMRLDAEDALQEYLEVQFHMKRIARPLVTSQLVEHVTSAAPGLRDILLLGKIWYIIEKRRQFDLVVLDTAASGHAVSMLRSPEGFLHAVPVGPLANHARLLTAFLKDREKVSVNLAAIAEEMPVNETVETTHLLEQQLGIDVNAIFVNMLLPPLSEDPEVVKALSALGSTKDLVQRASSAGGKLSQHQARELLGLAEFYRSRRALQEEHLKDLRDRMSGTADLVTLPFLFHQQLDISDIDRLAEHIGSQLGS